MRDEWLIFEGITTYFELFQWKDLRETVFGKCKDYWNTRVKPLGGVICILYPHVGISMKEGHHTESNCFPWAGLPNPLSFLSSKIIKIFGRPVYFMDTKAPLVACTKLDPFSFSNKVPFICISLVAVCDCTRVHHSQMLQLNHLRFQSHFEADVTNYSSRLLLEI